MQDVLEERSPKRALRAHSEFRRNVCLWHKQTCSIRCCRDVFPCCNKKFPVPIAGNSSKEVSCFNGFMQAGRAFQRKFPIFSPESGNSAGRDALAADFQHSHLVAGFLALYESSPNRPDVAPKCATKWRCSAQGRTRDTGLSGRASRFCRFISPGHFRGSHSTISQNRAPIELPSW